MKNFLHRLMAVFLAVALPFEAAHAAESSGKSVPPSKPVLLPGEYAVSSFDLARGVGAKWGSCVGHVTIGPGIAPSDLELTYFKENSFRMAIKGTGDVLVCAGFYTPSSRDLAHKTVFRFYDANRWSFEDIDKRVNLRALATPATQSAGPAPAPTPSQAAPVTSISASKIFKCTGTDGRITYTADPCPGSNNAKPQSKAPTTVHNPPTVQRGLWIIKYSRNGEESQLEHCGDPFEKMAQELQQTPQMQKAGCSYRTASPAPRSYRLTIDCPADWVSANGSERIKKGQVHLSIDSPTPQSFSMSQRLTAPPSTHLSLQGVRVKDC